MKKVSASCGFFALVAVLFIFCLGQKAWAVSDTTGMAVVTVPFAKIYKTLNPDSGIVKLAKKNERYQIDVTGTKWFRVWIVYGDSMKPGYIAANEVKVEYGSSNFGKIMMIIAALVLLIIAAGSVVRVIKAAAKGPEK